MSILKKQQYEMRHLFFIFIHERKNIHFIVAFLSSIILKKK